MGQKVMPTGFRLGITEDWRSRWYSDKDYAKNLENDIAIRRFLDKYLAKAAVSKVEIERAGDKVKVIIVTARPGVVIGKKGAEIENLPRLSAAPSTSRSSRSSAPSSMRLSSLSLSLSSSRVAWHSAAQCARLFSLLASPVLRASVSSAPVVWAALR